MTRILVIATLLFAGLAAQAQNVRVNGIVPHNYDVGTLVSVCAQTSITSASEIGNIVTIGTTLAPLVGDTVVITGVVPVAYNGTVTVTKTGPTKFSFISAQSNLGTGTSFGTVVDLPCTNPVPLCISTSDVTCAAPNPVVSDANGNYAFYLQNGQCTAAAPCALQFYGIGLPSTNFADQSFVGGTGVGTITGVTASTGLSGGGSSGTVSLSVTNPIPTGVATGSVVVSNGVSQAPVYQSKPILDARDIAGIDCTGVSDSATALNALTGNVPTSNDAISQRTLSFGNCLQIKLASTWLIKNQAGFIIDCLTRSGGASKGCNFSWAGAANGVMIDMEFVDGFQVQGINIQGNSTAGVGIQIDKNGSGGTYNTTDGRLVNNTYQGANQNWIGVSLSPVSGNNVEDMRLEDSTFYCNATRATTNAVGVVIGASANAKNEIIKHGNFVQCLFGIWQKSGSMQVRESEFSANGGTCGSGSGADIRIDGTTDVDIIEGNLDENSTQGINQNNDNSGSNPSHPVIVRGNHGAPAGCENTSNFWYNTGRGAATWIFEGDSWDADSSLTKLIGSGSTGANGTIYTRGLLYPNSIFTPWWTNYTTAVSDDLKIDSDKLKVYAAKSSSVPDAGSNYFSPVETFRGYLNGSTSNPDDFVLQNVPSGTAGLGNGGTFLIKHQQGTSGTEMFGWDGSYPGLSVLAISTPGTIGVNPVGGTGSTSYTYSVVAYGGGGNTAGSATTNISNGVAFGSLSSTVFNQISWRPVSGATKYCVWRTVGGSTQGDIGCTSAAMIQGSSLAFSYTVNASATGNQYLFNDTGLAGDSASLPGTNTTGQITSTVSTGTAPFVVSSTTNVANLNASSLNGATFAAPGAIGGTTSAAGTFTTLTATSLSVNGVPIGNILTNTTAVTASNPTANTDTALMEIALPTSYLNTLGQPFSIYAGGVLTTTTASVPQVTITAKLCSVSGCGSGTVTPLAAIQSTALNTTAITNSSWSYKIAGVTTATGVSCNFIIKGDPGLAIELGNATTVADSIFLDSNTAVSSPNQNCANALFLDFFVQQSQTGASNSYKQQVGIIR